jgi:hypothetical protein
LSRRTRKNLPDPSQNHLFIVGPAEGLVSAHDLRNKPVVFTHIPKTAGTTLDRIFEAFSFRCNIQRQRMDGTIYGQYLGEGKSDVSPSEVSTTVEKLPPNGFLSGHFPFGPDLFDVRPSINVTILRNPIDRSRSHFLFGAERGGWDVNIDPSRVFQQGLIADNAQVRQLSGCMDLSIPCDEAMLDIAVRNVDEKFDFVGVSERFDEFLGILLSALNLPTVAYRKATVGKLKSKKKKLLPESHLLPFNVFDQKLYEHVAAKKNTFREGVMVISPPNSNAVSDEMEILIANPFVTLAGDKFPLVRKTAFEESIPQLKTMGFKVHGLR